MTLPLTGVRVVSLTHYLQGPACVQYLADLGADVVKVERRDGGFERHWSGARNYVGEESVFFHATGRNQRSVEIDLRSPRGAAALWRLIERADVLVENFRSGVLERRGFGYDTVKARNPGIVYCSLSGFGPTGPRSRQPGQDLLIQSMSGMMLLSGSADDPPTPFGTAIVDQHAAALGAMGVLAALLRRGVTGEGSKVDASLLSAALDLQIEPFNYHLNGRLFDRSASRISTRFHQAPYGVFRTSDGWMTLSLSDCPTLADVLGEARLAAFTDTDQFDRREEVNELVAARLGSRTTAQWLQACAARGVWSAEVNDYHDLEADPQLIANSSILAYQYPGAGPMRVLAHPILYDGETPQLRRMPPRIGEHTDEVLSELGYGEDEIRTLREDSAIGPDRSEAPG